MAVHTLRREQFVARPIEEVFEFFSNARNLETITPSWLNFRILTPSPIHMHAGTLLDYRLKWHGLPIAWQTEIEAWNPPYGFTDVQLKGPYKLWHHTHTFQAQAGGTLMEDVVRYELPLGVLGEIAHAVNVRRDLERVFDYRVKVIGERFGAEVRRQD
jgi:ligand-binding SRPBCC domain-containing protein